MKISNFKFQIGLLATIILIGIAFSKNQPAGIYGFIKLLEFIFLGFYTARNIKRLNFGIVLLLFSIGIIFESFLAILQYFNQGSMGGFFYFFGERTFNAQTPGIANASVNGELILRPYATFSHPNVLAGYLLIGMVLIPGRIMSHESIIRKAIFISSLLIGSVSLVLAMSRVAIVVWFIIVGFQGITYAIKKLKNARPMIHKSSFIIRPLIVLVFICSIGSIILLSPLRFRFADIKLTDESIVVRQELIKSSFLMIKDNPLFGVGLNNFLVELPNYQKIKNYFIDLQPVHNIYLLILSQTGIVGFAFFIWFVFKTFKNLKIKNSFHPDRFGIKFQILSTVLVLGLFDHYFLTLQQGQLLFSFVLGLCWSDSSKRQWQ